MATAAKKPEVKQKPEERILSKEGAGGYGKWIAIRLEGKDKGKKNQPVTYGLKVLWKGMDKGREYFTVLEGELKGIEASVVAFSSNSNASRFSKNIKHLPGGHVKFDVAKQAIWFGDKGPFNAFSGGGFINEKGIPMTPISPGKYFLCIPDADHAGPNRGRPYGRWSKCYETWFKITAIGNDGTYSRFLHTGELSDGCVTVRAFVYDSKHPDPDFSDLPRKEKVIPGFLGLPYPKNVLPTIGWDDIYDYLILRRLAPHGKYVGTLEVI
jgi:hypothetical protein